MRLLLDAAMAGPDPRDRRSLYAAAPHGRSGEARILYIPQFGDAPVDPEVDVGHRACAAALWRGTAMRFGRASVFFDLEDAARIWHVISRAGVAWLMRRKDGRLGALAGASVARDGRRRREAHRRRLHRRAGAGCRLSPPLRRAVRRGRSGSHAHGRRLALAGCTRRIPIGSRPRRQAARSRRLHRLGEHCRHSSDQPAGRGLGSWACRSACSSSPGSLATPPCSHSPTSSRGKIRRLRSRC